MTSARAPAGMGATELRLSRTGSPIRAPRGWVPPEPGSPRYDSGGSAVAGSHVNTHRLARLTKAVFSASGQGDMRALDLIAAQAPAEVDAHLDWGWRVSHVAAACGMDEVLAWLVLERPGVAGGAERRRVPPVPAHGLVPPASPASPAPHAAGAADRFTPMHYAAANGQFDALKVPPPLLLPLPVSLLYTHSLPPPRSMRSRCCRPLLIRPPPHPPPPSY